MRTGHIYEDRNLDHVAFPMGGLGAGMICIQGSGMLGNFSIMNSPDVHLEPNVFSSLCIKGKDGNTARVMEGQVPSHKIFGHPTTGKPGLQGMGNGLHGKNYGLPRFPDNNFSSRFPFADLQFFDDKIPLDVSISAWSPFIPLDSDNSSLPVSILEFSFTNTSNDTIEAVYGFNAQNFLAAGKKNTITPDENKAKVFPYENGFILHQPEDKENEAQSSWFMAASMEKAFVNTDWYDGGWFDKLTMLWKNIETGEAYDRHDVDNESPGGSIIIASTGYGLLKIMEGLPVLETIEGFIEIRETKRHW